MLCGLLTVNWPKPGYIVSLCFSLQGQGVFDTTFSHYVIKFVSDLWQFICFLSGTLISSTNKTDCHDIIEILLKMALNTKPLPYKYIVDFVYKLSYTNVSVQIWLQSVRDLIDWLIYLLVDWLIIVSIQWAVFQLYSEQKQD